MSDEEPAARGANRTTKRINNDAKKMIQVDKRKGPGGEDFQEQRRVIENAFLGYGAMDVLAVKWDLGPNKRSVMPGEVNKLKDSFIRHGMKWWDPEHMMTIAVTKDHIDLTSLTERPPTLEQAPIRRTDAGQGQTLMHLGGGHRLAALREIKKDWTQELEEAEKYLAKGGLSDENRQDISEKKEKLETWVKNTGTWGVRVLDNGKSPRNHDCRCV
jgi:hypothetical protein